MTRGAPKPKPKPKARPKARRLPAGDRGTPPALRSVAIVAMGPSHRSYTGLASIYGDRCRLVDETWAINAMGTVIQHDLLFHMDDCRIQEARAKADPDGNVAGMVSWLKAHPKFITSRVYDDYPGARAYPLQEVVDAFGHAYFNSTVAYAMAYALHRGFSRIELYGCDYSYPDAHRAEKGRACLEFWIGMAASRGVQVVVAADSTLMDSNAPLCERLYGYDAYDLQLIYKDGRAAPIVDWVIRRELPSVGEIERRYRNEKVQ